MGKSSLMIRTAHQLRDAGDTVAVLDLTAVGQNLTPEQCAGEVAHALSGHPRLKLWMGIHSGPVSRTPDINGKDNVTGSSTNTAQRVMDCGDAGHILLSSASADVIREFEAWAASLRDLGECEVKHGQRLHLCSLVLGEVGNAASPSRLACVPAPVSPPTPPLSARPAGPAQEIARRIWEADAMVVLLSESSRRSEMLEYEVQTVQSAAQAQGGKPRLLARPAGLHQSARRAAGRDPGPAALQPVGDGGGRYADRERSRAGVARAAPRPGSGQARASRRGGAA